MLRVYIDIVTMVGKDNGSYLVLLDLSAAFDTIYYDTLFVIIDNYIGITGSALQLIKAYFLDRSQRVLIDDAMLGVANIVCGVPQGSALCPLKFCLYLLPLGAILKYHGIGYYIYADDTQLYISLKCNMNDKLPKLNNCISDIRVWMIKNKLMTLKLNLLFLDLHRQSLISCSSCSSQPTPPIPQPLSSPITTKASDEDPFTILQFNANGIGNKQVELSEFLERHKVAVIQQSKLTLNSRMPSIQYFTTVRKDRHRGR